METIFKTTQIRATVAMKVYVEEKIIEPVKRLLSAIDSSSIQMNIEVGRSTRHHRKGSVWQAKVILEMGTGVSLYAKAEEDSFEKAVDILEQEITREVKKIKGKRSTTARKGARRAKKNATIAKAARFYRKGRIREEGR